MKKNRNTTKPNFITKYYFNFIYNLILKEILEKKIVLDFGSGYGFLKNIAMKKKIDSKIINYDKISSLSEIKNWKKVNFDMIIFCQSIYLINQKNIIKIFKEIKKRKKKIIIISVFSNQTFLNKLFSIILGHKNAHNQTKTSPWIEEKLLKKYFSLVKAKNYILFKMIVLINN